jgi:hypothetical protein
MLRHVARGEIQYSLCQRGIHSCHSVPAPQFHVVSDAMTGALCAAVCEVLAVTQYQRQRMMESIDHVRLYQKFSKFNDADCFIVRYSSMGSVYPSILIYLYLLYSIRQDAD